MSVHNFKSLCKVVNLLTCIAEVFETFASSCASDTGYCRAHQYISISHFWSGSLDFSKKLPSLMLTPFWQDEQRQRQPSEMSLLVCRTIAVPQGHCLCAAMTCFDWRWVMMAGVPPNITGPISNSDILSCPTRMYFRAKRTWVGAITFFLL